MTSGPGIRLRGTSARRYAQDEPHDRTVLDDLERQLCGLHLIDAPVWVYDPERCQALWANRSGLEFWQAGTVEALRQRDVAATQSEAIYTLVNDVLRRVLAGERISEWVTFEAGGTSRRFNFNYHALELADGRAVLLIEARAAPSAEELLDFASDSTLTVGLYALDGRLISTNPAFRQLQAYQPLDELATLLPDDGPDVDWRAVIATQSEFVFDIVLETAAGRALFQGQLRQVSGQSGRPRALLKLVNLTEQRVRESERALIEYRARTEHLLDRAEVATYSVDIVQQLTIPDRRWWAMLGHEPDAGPLPFATWLAMLHPEDRAGQQAAAAAMLAQETAQWNLAYRMRSKDGSWRWILDRGAVTRRDGTGRPLEFSGICLDIDKQKRAEEALAKSEVRQRAILDALPDLIVVNDQDGRFVDVHAGNIEQWALPAGDVIGRNVEEVVPASVLAELQAVQAQVLASGRMVQDSFSVVHPELGTRFREFRMVPYDVGHTLTVVRDVTAQHLAERQHEQVLRQMQQAQKMDALGQLTGGIAHDFNNILASILGYAWLARQRPAVADDAKASEYLDIVTAAGERGRDLVQKLMTFSRRASTTSLEPIDPVPVVDEAFRMLKSIVPAQFTLRLNLPDACAAVAADAIELQQVLVNLVVNSRDALGEQGDIEVALAQRAVSRHCASC
ncbi:MAG: PAS domain-containing protein, partial [Gammaproteobacteria bacterium]